MTDSIHHNVTDAHISQVEGVAGGKPCISGTRIRVRDVYIWHELQQLSADDIAGEYNLSLAQVYAALTYAFEHLDEIRQDIRESRKFADALKSRSKSKIPDKFKNE
jgi:uncharacterized protein (DUF433 family)